MSTAIETKIKELSLELISQVKNKREATRLIAELTAVAFESGYDDKANHHLVDKTPAIAELSNQILELVGETKENAEIVANLTLASFKKGCAS